MHGQDRYLRQQRRREIIRRFTGDADAELVVASFDASAELSQVLDGLRTAPFLAPRRLVVVDDADKFVSAHRQALERYFAQPASTGSLLLLVDSWPANTKLAKLASKLGEVIDCSSLPDEQLPEWIADAAGARGKQIGDEAAELLAELIGNDLARLDSELEKLSLYAGRRPVISIEDVSAVVLSTAGPAPFALVNALRAGEVGQALTALDKMLTRRGEEFRVLGALAYELRQGRTASWRRWRGRAASSGFRRLLAADLAMKTGAGPLAAMQLLVGDLCL